MINYEKDVYYFPNTDDEKKRHCDACPYNIGLIGGCSKCLMEDYELCTKDYEERR